MRELTEQIERAGTIAIFGHIRPDGDCVGSCLGLYNYILDNYGKKASVFLEEIPEKFSFLSGAGDVSRKGCETVFDLAISLDCSDRDRHGDFSEIYGRAKVRACLDHHRSNQGFGDYFYCDPEASSTCEVLYRHLEEEKITKAVAECLYLGIVHDTGVFKYPSCKEETMRVAGRLLSMGVDAQKIIDDTFYRVSFRQNLLTGRALLNAVRYFDDQVIVTCVTEEMFQEFGATKEETEGIVDKIRVTEGVEVAVFVYQLGKDCYKFSLRSISRVDVSKIAVSFGGGGHIRAAGFEAKGAYEESLDKVLSMIEEQL